MKWVLFLVAGSALAQDAPPGDVKRGHAAFLKYQCYTCHGTVGQGAERGAGPKLAPNPFPWAGFEFQTRTPRQDMPAYRKEHLPDQELADIYAYVRSIKPSPAASAIPLLKID
jgi:ubiquinol-cytochrome c reductase cytochrome c subunit